MDKVLLGMSGGVDSTAAAIILKEKGYEVYGATMKLWEPNNIDTDSDAKKVCNDIGITHYTMDFKVEFNKRVIDDFICEYSNCRTPNPCIECNKYLKFGAMYKKAEELGIEYLATGHYAITEYSEKYGRVVLKKAKNLKKDQSYVLYTISKEILDKVIFPLGEFMEKEEIRGIVGKYNVELASKPDSEDICFIPDGNYRGFLEANSELRPRSGDIVNTEGKVLGRHNGLYNYTIGQRKGLGISNPKPLFVVDFDRDKNQLIVGEKDKIYRTEMFVKDINLLLIDELKDKIEVGVKIRYSAKEEKATIEMVKDNLIKVVFENPIARITPGQSAVFYIDDIVLGGGKIV